MPIFRWFVLTSLLTLLGAASRADNPAVAPAPPSAPPASLRFEVTAAPGLLDQPATGRLYVVLAPSRQPASEPPWELIGRTGSDSPPVLGRDASPFPTRGTVGVGDGAAFAPFRALADLPAGEYLVQAVLATNRDLCTPGAPGNLVSRPVRLKLNPRQTSPVTLTLAERLPSDAPPPDSDLVRFVKFRSAKLTEFHGRPIFLRAGILLPRTFTNEAAATRRYPLLVRIGGQGTRYTSIAHDLAHDDAFRSAWLAPDAPQFVLLQLDGLGPYGDPYQVNSANNGPYGDAVVQELIPYVEAAYRGLAEPHARVLTGGSTGGWVSLALQVFYPDVFGGSWSGYPDSPDFRAFQLVNIYEDRNALVEPSGADRASKRGANGATEYTMRQELQVENVVGFGDSYTRGGLAWGSWNAVYGPRGADGQPVPLWDPRTGVIDRAVVEHWKDYDLRRLLELHWTNLAPRLRGKIHLWVGESDDYFLERGSHLLEAFLRQAQPPADATFRFEPGAVHGWDPQPFGALLKEMQAHIEKRAPRTAEEARDAQFRARFAHGPACPHCRLGR